MISFIKRLRYRPYCIDAALILLLVGFSLYLMRHLFDWNTGALASDLSGAWAWFYWLKESLLTFHQFPTWSPLWMGGMPFFGIIPPAGYYFILPVYLLTGDIPAAYNLATIIMFSLAGVPMYLYLKHLSRNTLASFLGAVVYLILPVHTNSMMFWGHFEILCAYAVAPLVLLFTDKSLDGKSQINMVLLGLLVSFVLLLQIEYALIFLLFYLCYLLFALSIRGMGLRSMSALIRRNRVGVIICLLILLVPLSFYITVLAQYGRFSSLTPEQIEGGLSVYTLKHFSDPFQLRLAGGLENYFNTPQTDYYAGPLSFVILLAAMLFAILEKGQKRAQLLFFLITGMASLILSMGIFGPLFPVLREIIPFLSGMRVPLRFYYVFALCLPVLFALTFLSFSNIMDRVPKLSNRTQGLLVNGVPLLLLVVLILDLSPYFDFYRHRVLDRDAYNRVSSFVEERIREDGLPADGIARVLVVPDGVEPDRIARLEKTDGSQFAIEVSQSWLTWNQYKAAFNFDTTVRSRILRDKHYLDFYIDLLSYDYVMRYEHKFAPAALNSTYLYLMDQLAETLNAFSADESGILIDKGFLETDYYKAQLYRINRSVLPKTRFHASNGSVFIDNGGLCASSTLFEIYSELSGQATSNAVLSNVVAVSKQKGLPETISSEMASVRSLCLYDGEALLLPDNPLAAQVVKIQNCQTSGWEGIDRLDSWGFPDSGQNMAIADVTGMEDNYLSTRFVIEEEGSWAFNISYFSDNDTGTLEVYVDGLPVATIDTYGPAPSMKNYSAELFLNKGSHVLNLMAGRSPRIVTTGAMGNWVEVGRISLLNLEELPQIVAQSRDLWSRILEVFAGDSVSSQVSDFRLSPRGISLDIYAAGEGILSVAYYSNPWWRVYVDGKEVKLLKVNGVFPGCYIQSGQHHIEFVYDYPSLTNISFFLGR